MLGLMMIDEFITVEDTKEIKTGEKAIVTGFVSRIEKFGGGYKLNLKNKDFEILIFTNEKKLDVSYGEKVKVEGHATKNTEIVADKVDVFSFESGVKPL